MSILLSLYRIVNFWNVLINVLFYRKESLRIKGDTLVKQNRNLGIYTVSIVLPTTVLHAYGCIVMLNIHLRSPEDILP